MFPFTTELLWARRLGGQEWRAGYNAAGGKRRDEDAKYHRCCGSPVLVPFHGSANLERFPRTSESALGERDAGERDSKRQESFVSWINSCDCICFEQQLAKCAF